MPSGSSVAVWSARPVAIGRASRPKRWPPQISALREFVRLLRLVDEGLARVAAAQPAARYVELARAYRQNAAGGTLPPR